MTRKNVPDQFGRLYIDDVQNGCQLGIWVRRAEVDALLDEIDLLKSNNKFASNLADDLTQDGIKERARIAALEARCRTAQELIMRLCEPAPIGEGRREFFDNTWAACQAWLIGFEKETGKTMSELFDRIVDRDAQWKKEIINTETWPIADRRWLIGRVRELEAALKDWINQAGMYAHWSPERIQEAINQYFASETK